jgi:excisionase family DNA binding protein
MRLEQDEIDEIARKVIGGISSILLERDSNQTDEDELLTPDEAAQFLKTSRAQIYQWVNQSQHGLGQFPYYKSGKLLRFSKNEIMKWLKSSVKH